MDKNIEEIIKKLRRKHKILNLYSLIFSFVLTFCNFLILILAFISIKSIVEIIQSEKDSNFTTILTLLAFSQIIVLFIINIVISFYKVKNYHHNYQKIYRFIELKLIRTENAINPKWDQTELDVDEYIKKEFKIKKFSFKKTLLKHLKGDIDA